MKGQEKRFREFTNMLVMYLLEERGMKVELADESMPGVDLIAAEQKKDEEKKYAITLVRRNIPDTESKQVLFEKDSVNKLETTAKELGYIPMAVFVIIDTMESSKKFRFVRVDLEKLFKMCENQETPYVNYAADGQGIWLNYNKSVNVNWLDEIISNNGVDYMEAQINYR